MVRESSFYPLVKNYIKNKFNCFVVRRNKGIMLGRADVIGVRYIYGDLLSTFEVIAVEVKGGKEPFVKAAGQAYGYSIYAHRCYLAEKREHKFSNREIDIAGKLGIGLIEIKEKHCREVLSSPYHNPIEPHMFELLKNLGYVKCTICGTLSKEKSTSRSIKTALKDGKPFKYFLDEFYGDLREKYDKHTKRSGKWYYDRRYVCCDCLTNLLLPLRNMERTT